MGEYVDTAGMGISLNATERPLSIIHCPVPIIERQPSTLLTGRRVTSSASAVVSAPVELAFEERAAEVHQQRRAMRTDGG
jgi:hypothetical protein